MVLTPPSSTNTTPLDSSNAEGVLQSLYRAAFAPFNPGNGDLDATLLEEDQLLSSSDTGGMVISTISATSMEGSMIDKLRSVQQSGKSAGLMNSSGELGISDSSVELGGVDLNGGLGGVVSDPAKFASLSAGGDSFDGVLMEDQDNRDYNEFVDTASMAPNLPSLDHVDLASESWALRNRSSLVDPLRFRSLTVPKVERRVKTFGSFDAVKLFLVKNISVTICGGIIGALGLHACVDAVISGKPLGLSTHTMLKPRVCKHKVYLTHCIDITILAREILAPLLTIERTVDVWSLLLPRLPFRPSSEASELVASVDMDVESKCNFQTPSKKQQASDQLNLDLNDLSYAVENIAVTQDLDDLLPLLFSRINDLTTATEQLRQGFTTSSSDICEDFSKLHLNLRLLRDNLGSDPGLTSFPLRSDWGEICLRRMY